MESEISLAPEILSSLEHALAEDIRTGDVTTNSIIPAQATLEGQIISKQSGIVAGLFIAQAAFQMLDKRVSLTSHVNDGERIEADRVLAEVKGTARAILSQIEFIRPCNLCPHMKRITLPKILRSLQTMEHQIEIDPALATRARQAVERMIAIGRGARD